MDGPGNDHFAFWKLRSVRVTTLVTVMLLAASILVFGVWLASGLSHNVGVILEMAAAGIILLGWAGAVTVLLRLSERSEAKEANGRIDGSSE